MSQQLGLETSPSMAQDLLCTVSSKAARQTRPSNFSNRQVIEHTTSKDTSRSTKTELEYRKGLSILKAMTTKGIDQHHAFLLFHSAFLCDTQRLMKVRPYNPITIQSA